jgi:hypothetical protein
MFWLKLCRLNLYRICFKFEAPSYICRWNYINDLTTYLRKTFYTKYQWLCVYYYHNMLDNPGFMQITSDFGYAIIIICLMTHVLHKAPVTVSILLPRYVWWPRFSTKYQSLCVYYYHTMFDDPVLYKVPVTVCMLLS